jgi:bifunctional non-homologous end joining protein LigD
VRPVDGAPVSAPMKWDELKKNLDPVIFNINTMPARMALLGNDPFLDVLQRQTTLEESMTRLEELVADDPLPRIVGT